MRKNYSLLTILFIASLSLSAQDFWKTYSKKEGLVDSVVVDLAMNGNKIFIATPRGFSVFENESFQNYDTLNSSLPSQNIRIVRQFNDTAYLVTDSGLTQFFNGNMIHFNVDSGLLSNRITDIEVDSKGTVWIASLSGLSQKVGNGFLSDPSRDVYDIAINKGDTIYANTFNSAIVNVANPVTAEIFSNGTWTAINDPSLTNVIQSAKFVSLSDSSIGITSNNSFAYQVNNLFDLTNLNLPADVLNPSKLTDMDVDSEGNYWFSIGAAPNVDEGGLIKYDGADTVYYINGLPFGNVRTLKAGNGKIYIGTDRGISIADDSIRVFPSLAELETKNIKTRINSNGILFSDLDGFSGGFEMPKGSGKSSIFAAALWITGTNSKGEALIAKQQIDAGDYAEGAINDFGVPLSPNLIQVSKSEIDQHLSNYQLQGYQVPDVIKNWPAAGRTQFGEAEGQAPFIDANDNGCYDPENGDYPAILGDECVYLVINDGQQPSTGEFTPNFNFDVQIMIYAYNRKNIDYLENTIFLRYALINRSDEDYQNLRTAFYYDFDLGNALDDAVGCDPSSNISFSYNFDGFDEQFSGFGGYDSIIPSSGMKLINEDLDGFMGYDNSGFNNADDAFPFVGNHYFKAMNMRWNDSLPVTVGGNGYNPSQTNITKFRYPGDPSKRNEWSQLNPGANYLPNGQGEVRTLSMIPTYNLLRGDRKIIDMVVGVGYDSANVNDRFSNHELMLQTLNQAAKYQAAVDSISPNWSYSACTVGISEKETESLKKQFVIYPNPAQNQLNLVSTVSILDLTIFDIQGKTVLNRNNLSTDFVSLKLNESLKNGLYLIRFITEDGKVQSSQFLLQR